MPRMRVPPSAPQHGSPPPVPSRATPPTRGESSGLQVEASRSLEFAQLEAALHRARDAAAEESSLRLAAERAAGLDLVARRSERDLAQPRRDLDDQRGAPPAPRSGRESLLGNDR